MLTSGPSPAFSLSRLPVHRLAAQALLQALEGAAEKEAENKEEACILALETSLSSGLVCSQTACVVVNTQLGKPIQSPLIDPNIPFESELKEEAMISEGPLVRENCTWTLELECIPLGKSPLPLEGSIPHNNSFPYMPQTSYANPLYRGSQVLSMQQWFHAIDKMCRVVSYVDLPYIG